MAHDELADWRPPGPRDWKCHTGITDHRTMHLRPRNDLIWHPAADECPCGPTITVLPTGDYGARHHALDGRRLPDGDYHLADEPVPPRGDCTGAAA